MVIMLGITTGVADVLPQISPSFIKETSVRAPGRVALHPPQVVEEVADQVLCVCSELSGCWLLALAAEKVLLLAGVSSLVTGFLEYFWL